MQRMTLGRTEEEKPFLDAAGDIVKT